MEQMVLADNLSKCKKRIKTTLSKVAHTQQKPDLADSMRTVEDREKISNDHRTQGNLAYKEGSYEFAHRLYTSSLSAAATSITRAMAYANRSAALFHMRMFPECLRDITRALNSGYPNDKKYILFIRQAKCLMSIKGEWKSSAQMAFDSIEVFNSKEYAKLKEVVHKELQQHMAVPVQQEPRFLLNNRNSTRPPSLSYGENEKVACLSSAVTLKYSKAKGRHLVATRKLEIGDVVIREESFATAVDELAQDVCVFCCQITFSAVPCEKCGKVLYCSEECRVKDWHHVHKQACQYSHIQLTISEELGQFTYKSFAYNSPASTLLFNIIFRLGGPDQILKNLVSLAPLKWDSPQKGLASVVGNELKLLMALVDNFEANSSKTISYSASASLAVAEILGVPQKQVELFAAFVLKMILVIKQNALMIGYTVHKPNTVMDEHIFGMAIYFASSFVNHACNPNMVLVSYGSTAVCKIIRPVEEGEELTLSYHTDDSVPIDKRRDLCSFRSNFHCMCSACEDGWPDFDEMPVRFKTSEFLDVCFEVGVPTVSKDCLIDSCIDRRVTPCPEMFKSIAQMLTLMHQSQYYPDQLYYIFQLLVKHHLLSRGSAIFLNASKDHSFENEKLSALLSKSLFVTD